MNRPTVVFIDRCTTEVPDYRSFTIRFSSFFSQMQQVKSKKKQKTQEKKQKLLESRKNLADVRCVCVCSVQNTGQHSGIIPLFYILSNPLTFLV